MKDEDKGSEVKINNINIEMKFNNIDKLDIN